MMRQLFRSSLLLILFSYCALAQTTAITATITDSDSQTWNNGTFTAVFVPSPSGQPPQLNGVPYNPAPVNGILNGSGLFTVSLQQTTAVFPSGSAWQFTICPNASGGCSTMIPIATSTTTANLSTSFSNQVKAPRFPARGIEVSRGYSDTEVTPTPLSGGSYWSVTSSCERIWQGSSWACLIGTGNPPGTPLNSIQINTSGAFTGYSAFTYSSAGLFGFNGDSVNSAGLFTSIDGINNSNGPIANSSSLINTGDALFGSGRPWYDVMYYGAKNNGATDDTAAIQSAVNLACSNGGGLIWFPATTVTNQYYLLSGTSGITPTCSNIAFAGSAWSMTTSPQPPSYINCPNCTAGAFNMSGSAKYGVSFTNLGISSGGASNAASVDITLTNVNNPTIQNVFFNNAGGPCLFIGGGNGATLINNIAQNCNLSRPSSDSGAFDLNNTDVQALYNVVTSSTCTPTCASPGQIGNGHSWSWNIRSGSGNGQFYGNDGDQSQQGWLIAGPYNKFTNNRAFQNQGVGFSVSGSDNTFVGNISYSNSTTANNAYSGFSVSGSQEVFSDNECDAQGIDTNLQKNCFDDVGTANGYTAEFANRYSNNRVAAGPGPSAINGVLYNITLPLTGIGYIINGHWVSIDNGDAGPTFKCGESPDTELFQTALTNARAVTLSSTGAYPGCHFHVVCTATACAAHNLTVSGKVLGAGQWVDFEYTTGSAWLETAFGSL